MIFLFIPVERIIRTVRWLRLEDNTAPPFWLLIFPIFQCRCTKVSMAMMPNVTVHNIPGSTASLTLTVPRTLGYFGTFSTPRPIFTLTP